MSAICVIIAPKTLVLQVTHGRFDVSSAHGITHKLIIDSLRINK